MGILPPKIDPPASTPEDRSAQTSIDSVRPNWMATAAKITAGFLGLGLLGFIGASIWVATNLSPTIARELTKALDRQVAIGPVENIGFNEINFGASSLAATNDSPNKVAVKAIKISFDPLAILWQNTIKPTITLVEPDLYLEQSANGDWLRLKLPPAEPDKPGDFRTEIQALRVQKARGTVIPYLANGLRQPIEFQNTDFNANFNHRDRAIQLINFDGKSQIGKDAKLSLRGSTSPIDRTTNLDIEGQSLNAKEVSNLIKIPAVDFLSGLVGGNLSLNIQPNKPLEVQGKVHVDQATIQVIKVPQVFTNTSGDLQISPQDVKFSNVSTLYGQVPGQITGSIDFAKGYDLQAKTAVLPVTKLLETLKIKSPVFLAAQLQSDLTLTGKLQEPVFAGKAKAIGAAQIDRVAINQLQGDFSLADGNLQLNQISATPASGGTVTGNGEISLKEQATPTVNFKLQGNKLLADVLAQPYQKLPIALGVVNGSAQITGPVDQIKTTVQVQAPQATYPLNAQIGIAADGAITVDRAKFQLAGHDITGTGSSKQGLWQARLQVPAIPSQQLAAIAKIKDLPAFLKGNVQGDLQLNGSVSNNESLSGKGQLYLQTAGGRVSATNFAINQGKWQADLQTAGLMLGKVDPQLPGQLTGKFKVSGDTAKSSPEAITAVGNGAVTLPDGKITGQNLLLSQGKWQGEFSADSFDISKLAPQVGGKLSGKFQASGDATKFTPATISASGSGTIASAQGKITGQNLRVEAGKWQGDFSADRFDISKLTPQIGGNLSGKFQANGDLEKSDLKNITGSGSGSLRLGGGEIVGKNLQLNQGNWHGNVAVAKVPLGRLSPNIPKTLQTALLNGNLQVAGSIEHPEQASVQGDAAVKLGNGQITAKDIQVGEGRWQGLVTLQLIDLNQLSLPQKLPAGQVDGTFQLAGVLDQPKLETAKGSGKLRLPGALLVANQLELNGNEWRGKFQTTNLAMGQFASLPPNLSGIRVSSNFDLSGNLKNPQQVDGGGSGKVVLGNSEVALQKWQLNKGNWQVAASTTGLSLGALGSAVPANLQGGVFKGNVDLSGSLSKPQLTAISGKASGELAIWGGSIAVAPVQIADGRWQSDAITIRNINLANVAGNNIQVLAGRVSGNGQAGGRLDRFDIKDLRVDSNVQLSGLLLKPNIGGQVPSLPPTDLAGPVKIVDGKIDLDLAGNNNSLSLHGTDQGFKFAGRLAGITSESLADGRSTAIEAEGEFDGKQIRVSSRGVPIDLITSFLPPLPQLKKQELKGIVGGELSIDLPNGKIGRIEGKNLSIDNPQFGILKGDRLQSGSVRYADGLLIVQDGMFLRGKNSYLIDGRVITKAQQPEYQLVLRVDKGDLSDVSNLFQIFSLGDVLNPFGDRGYGRATDLQAKKVGNESQTLQEQVEQLSEVQRLQGIQKKEVDENPLPDLRKLRGDFRGRIVLNNADKQGVYVSFNVSGNKWVVDQYGLSKVKLQGLWQNNMLTLPKASFNFVDPEDPGEPDEPNDTTDFVDSTKSVDDLTDFSAFADSTNPSDSTKPKIRLSGNFSMNQQNAIIKIDNFPAERLSSAFKLPIEIAGDVNLKARLGGSFFNPQLCGNATIVEGKLNQSTVPTIYTNFNYNSARLGFNSVIQNSPIEESKSFSNNVCNSNITVDNNVIEPLQIAGSIPYQLPFAKKTPDNQNFSINLKVQNKGMKALSILTQQQLDWVNGDGQINVLLKGKIDRAGKPEDVTARGDATIANAVLKAVALPNNLTGVNGQISFDLDRIKVDNFRGQYGTGEIVAQGSILIEKPLNLPDPLTVNLDKIQVDLKDRYQGGVSGRLLLGDGTILAPRLGGEIKLSNGKISLPETPAAGSTSLSAPSDTGSALQFKSLDLLLGENVQVEKAPILSFLATGKVNLNGPMDNLQPEGLIQLGRGQINLFTTRFRLTGNENTARFTPDRGADPIVNLQLSTKVLETSRLPSVNSSNERIDIDRRNLFSTNFGAVQTVQVDAKVNGAASQATNLLSLTSTPNRSQDEIFLLLGNGLGRISPDESGLLNFAGSTAITYVQDIVSDLLGLSDFRIYPALTRQEQSTTSTLGVAAELGLDLNKNVSASVFKILTSGEAPQYSIRYRINDRLLLRGSSNLLNESRAILEYENRF
jgi:translocation and assembly module TamB